MKPAAIYFFLFVAISGLGTTVCIVANRKPHTLPACISDGCAARGIVLDGRGADAGSMIESMPHGLYRGTFHTTDKRTVRVVCRHLEGQNWALVSLEVQ